MFLEALTVFHIAVLGYWLGSELVINRTYRFVSWASSMPFDERDKLMDHVLIVDQHVRYALVLQAGTGLALAALLGYLPGGETLATAAIVFAILWLVLVEISHRARKSPVGRRLALIDLILRSAVMIVFAGLGAAAVFGSVALDTWLGIKLMCFAGVIACGIGIRAAIIKFYVVWQRIRHAGSTPDDERVVKRVYMEGTSVLVLLWVFIAAIAVLSVFKPI